MTHLAMSFLSADFFSHFNFAFVTSAVHAAGHAVMHAFDCHQVVW